MEAGTPHTRGLGDSGARPCRCGNKISSRDPHQVCSGCLGLEHARLAFEVPGLCQHCAVFTVKSLRRRLARQASLSGFDPYLPFDGAAVEDGEERGVVAVAAPEASASWGSQLEIGADPPQEEDVLVLDYGDDEECASDLLISEDEDEDDIFMTPARAAQPAASIASRDGDEGSTPASPLPSSDMLDVCKREAAWLAIPWPAVIAETTRSRYEGKKLPLARSATKQLLPVFPELLVEVARSWRDRPHSSRSPIPGASSLNCEAMESLGLLRMPPMEPLVAAHLHMRLSAVSSRSPRLPSKSYVRILGRLRTRLCGKRYRSSPTCVSMSNAARSRPRDERWGLWFCRNERGGSTSPTCRTGRRMTSWTCPLFRRGFLAPRWPQCNSGVKPKRRRMKLSGFASLESPQLPLHLRCAKALRRLLPRFCSLKFPNRRNLSPPRPPCPVEPAGPRNPRPRLRLRRNSPRRLSTARPGRRREWPYRPSLHR